MTPLPDRIVFFGHHKCGSRFFRMNLFEQLAAANGHEIVKYDIKSPTFIFETLHDLDLHNVDFEKFANSSKIVMTLSNAGSPVVRKLDALGVDFLGVHVTRDPRQLLVSNYFDHLKNHPVAYRDIWLWKKLQSDRPVLEQASLEEGLDYEFENITRDIIENQLSPWSSRPNVLELKLEEFSPDESTARLNIALMARFCGFTEIPDINLSNRFSNNDASKSWREILPPALKKKFKERYGDLLVRQGYERDRNW